MVKQHLKRLACPRTWPVERKNITFVSRPNPGAHKIEHGLPLVVLARDIIKNVRSTKELKYVLHNKDCLVDGSVCHDAKSFVGLMDVVSFPKADEHYRILINNKNKLYVAKIDAKEAGYKISKIMGKTTLKGNKTQLNLLDGRNVIVDDTSTYATGDSLVLELPSQKIKQHLKLEVGTTILLDAGRHVGTVATVDAVENDIIVVKTADAVFRTKKRYAIVVGKDKPLIALK